MSSFPFSLEGGFHRNIIVEFESLNRLLRVNEVKLEYNDRIRFPSRSHEPPREYNEIWTLS